MEWLGLAYDSRVKLDCCSQRRGKKQIKTGRYSIDKSMYTRNTNVRVYSLQIHEYSIVE